MHNFRTAIVVISLVGASSAHAGGLSDPIVEEDLIIQETSSSAGDILVPLLFLIFGGAVASS